MRKPEQSVVKVTACPDARYSGTANVDANFEAIKQLVSTLWLGNAAPEIVDRQAMAALAQLTSINPADAIEGQLALQMLACHNASMEAFRRAMLPQQSAEARAMNLSQATKLVRSYASLVEILNRHRGKAQPQVVRVERVTVESGGQAIVGNVHTGGGAHHKS